MRMNPHAGQTAAEWLAGVPARELAKVISELGEENMAKRIARRIVDVREATPIDSTVQLADIISAAIPEREKRQRKIHPATKTFQAIRMYINDELGHLRKGLQQALALLVPGGIVVAVSFHSLEDRIVKKIFRRAVQGERLPDRMPVTRTYTGGGFEYAAQLVRPSDDEIRLNPRSRSAKLRALRKTA